MARKDDGVILNESGAKYVNANALVLFFFKTGIYIIILPGGVLDMTRRCSGATHLLLAIYEYQHKTPRTPQSRSALIDKNPLNIKIITI